MDIRTISIRAGYGGEVKIEAHFMDNNSPIKAVIEKDEAEAILLQALKERGYTVDYTAPRQNYKRVIIHK